ncbi:MAG: cytochrome C [Rhodocyclaceae bacterium]|nr:MAG: cytochrome C [Rhodocyclaceae bacterium]
MKRIIATSLFGLLAALALPANADNYSVPKNAAFEEECASCHMAFPPQMLHADSWRAMMGNLSRHFGSDASLDEKRRTAITDFLVAQSGGRKTGDTRDARGKPLLRITETARFEKKHREIAAATWQRASIKSPANCTACHARAAAGDYNEHSIRIPK